MCYDDSNDEFDIVCWADLALYRDLLYHAQVGGLDWTFLRKRGHVGFDVLSKKTRPKYILRFNPTGEVQWVSMLWKAPFTYDYTEAFVWKPQPQRKIAEYFDASKTRLKNFPNQTLIFRYRFNQSFSTFTTAIQELRVLDSFSNNDIKFQL